MKIATREDLLRVLTRYEGAVQRAQDEIGEDAADCELTEAREALMSLLKQARVKIEKQIAPKPCTHPTCKERGHCVGHRPDGSV